jgi:glycosyl transferase family 25
MAEAAKNANINKMHIYLINLGRRPDRLAAMTAQAGALGLALDRVEAVDARIADLDTMDHWFKAGGPLGEIPQGDKACLLSHRAAWQMFLGTGDDHAVFLEDDVRLSASAGALLVSDNWIAAGMAVVKLEHYGPPGQRVLLSDLRPVGEDFQMGRMLSRHTGAAAYILSRAAAEMLRDVTCFDLPVDHLIFNPNNSALFAGLAPWQLLPAIARQQDGEKSDIEGTRLGLRRFGWTYVKREVVRAAYDLRLLPRQIVALVKGAKFVAMKTAD